MNRFEELWLMEERNPEQRSLAERASLVSRALHGLSEKDHAGWGLRSAECLAEAAKGVTDPYAPARGQGDLDEELGSAAERHKSCSCLFEDMVGTLVRKGGIQAIVEAFCALAVGRGSKTGSPWERASDPSQVVFNAALGKICSRGEWRALAQMMSHGPTLRVEQFNDIRAHDAEAVEDPLIATAVKKTVEERLAQIFSATAIQARCVSPFAAEDLTCGRASWIEALLGPVVDAKNSWGSLQALAAMRKQAEAIGGDVGVVANVGSLTAPQSSARERLMSSNRKARAFSKEDVAAAKKFEQKICVEIGRAISRVAVESPAHAARAAMTFCKESMAESWKNAGLGKVNAAQFIFARHEFLRGNGERGDAVRELEKKTTEDADREMGGAEINLIDCALLFRIPREKIVNLALQGHAPSDEFGRILRLSRIEKLYDEDYLLWMESFRANPAADPSHRQLRI